MSTDICRRCSVGRDRNDDESTLCDDGGLAHHWIRRRTTMLDATVDAQGEAKAQPTQSWVDWQTKRQRATSTPAAES